MSENTVHEEDPRKERPANGDEQDPREERFKNVVAIMLASVAILAAVIAFLQSDAGARSTTAYRQARLLTISSIGQRNTGQTEVGYGLYTAQVWYGLGMLVHHAQEQYDSDLAQGYQAVRDSLVEMSPLISTTYGADLARYEADVYLVRATELSEQAVVANGAGDAWDAKASSYIVQLAVLAVALALYGLAVSVATSSRLLFAIAASALVVVVIAWAALVYTRPIPTIPSAAIQAYARGVGLDHQGKPADAVAALDDALRDAPGYANALFERGNAHFALKEYQAAADDYEATRRAGRQDTSVDWNLGWSDYLLGRFEQAVQVDRRALEADGTLLPVRLNLALALLASGQGSEAQAEYEAAMRSASDQLTAARSDGQDVPYSFWFYLDTGAADLQALLAQLDGQARPWQLAPEAASVAQPEDVRQRAPGLAQQLKSWSVALEQTGSPPAGPVSAKITPFSFGPVWGKGGGGFAPALPRTPFETGASLDVNRQIYFPYGNHEADVSFARFEAVGVDAYYPISDTFAYSTDALLVYYDYQDMQDGQQVLWKVYVDGVEDSSLRRTESWGMGPSGMATKSLSFVFGRPGEYTVEMYVNNQLVQQGSFTVKPMANQPSPQILLEDSLKDPSSGMAVENNEDYTLQYTDTGYRILVSGLSTDIQSSAGKQFENVAMDVDVTKTAGPDSGEYGLICGLQSGSGWNGYGFLASADGYYSLVQWVDGERTVLDGPREAAVLRRGNSTNHLRVMCSDETLQLYINGEQLGYAYAPDLKMGEVALVAGTFDTAGMDVTFSNWVITEP